MQGAVRTFNICLVFLLMYNLLKQSKSFLNLWNFSLIYKRGQKKNEEDISKFLNSVLEF